MIEQKSIRVLIADDHTMVRRGLAVFIKAFDDLELVGEASDGAEAIEKCRDLEPDVILMDLKMPGQDGTQATRQIKRERPETQIVALTSFVDEELVQAALKSGAVGYMMKNATIDELADAIRDAAAGKSTLAPEATEALVRLTSKPQAPTYELTARELEVLALLVDGLTNAQIAQALVVSHSTVKFHVSSLLQKLDVSSRTEAVSVALKAGLLEP